ncbi:MAG: hypothetical protein RIC04_01665 [Parvibaculum sp.]|uniref:hypothetical protein n=1 Tax=Parvibaculum sp. TaxID=2024848 RepID=UPI0032EBBFFB
MTTLTGRAGLHPARWLARNPRTVGVGAALAAFLVVALRARPPGDLLAAFIVIVPALQAAFFAVIGALAAEDRDVPAGPAALRDFALWLGATFIAAWLFVLFTQASIDAFVRFGAPPMIGHAI